ncbi:hypothetical protein BC332_30361 [Capsicum chinense]|nr:hypothetical protein BC332_30361 [Capsicum chinense]
MSKEKTDPKGGNTEALLFISSLKALTLHLICGLGLISTFWYVKAVGRGLLAVPAGAVVNALGATILGAPVGFEYWIHLMLTAMLVWQFVPAACVFGSSWSDWHRIFARTKENESTDYMISLPAHGAVIGAWFGAWPMPLDWESPWQEWPICVTYGTIAGYLVGLVASSGCIFFRNHQQHLKEE